MRTIAALSIIFCLVFSNSALAQSKTTRTFTSPASSERLGACTIAKRDAQLWVKGETGGFLPKAELDGYGQCDCEKSESVTGPAWRCAVDATVREKSGAAPTKQDERVTEVISRNGKGSTQVEACDDAKWTASRAVKAWNGAVVDAGNCVCGESGLSGTLFRYECSVDMKYQRR